MNKTMTLVQRAEMYREAAASVSQNQVLSAYYAGAGDAIHHLLELCWMGVPLEPGLPDEEAAGKEPSCANG